LHIISKDRQLGDAFAGQPLVEAKLYDRWGKPEKAAEWWSKLPEGTDPRTSTGWNG
jgi:hypothetical protein